jgi:tRNA threonylcarbamoyladenosine biosynthesis protein TsaB
MKLLALDTATGGTVWTGVTGEGPFDPRSHSSPSRHDEVLAEGLASWLEVHGRDWPEAVAVGVGPGGFTGLRVGVAAATGLAAALGLPVVPLSSYEILAARAPEGALVWALPYGGRRDLRGRLMRGGPAPEPLAESVIAPPGEYPLPEGEEPLIVLGAGWERHGELLAERLGDRRVEQPELLAPEGALALAAAAAFQAGRATAPHELDVDYGADFVPTPKPRR